MTEPKSQHYVPKCLLKHFCIDGKTIKVTDLKINKTYETNIINVAQENHFYDFDTNEGKISIEGQFANLDDKASQIIDKMIKTESIGWMQEKDKSILEDFILCQFYRTRKSVNIVENFLSSNNVPLFDLFDQYGKLKKVLCCNDIDINDNVARVLNYNFLNHEEHNEIVRNSISSMEWVLFKAVEKQHFITSDNPAISYNCKLDFENGGKTSGFDLPHAQIFLPISSKLILTLTAKTMAYEAKTRLLEALMTGLYIEISDIYKSSVTGEAASCPDRLVKMFNEMQQRNSERCIYG